MMFQPYKTFLTHQSGPKTEVFQWLCEIQEQPFTELRHIYPLNDFPEAPVGAIEQTPLQAGPLNPVSTCPETGRPLYLHAFRDLSCALIRQGAPCGPAWEVLPTCLAIPARIHDISLKKTTYMARAGNIPFISLQARPDGLYASYFSPDATDKIDCQVICDLISKDMQTYAGQILSAPPVADPRIHANIPKGARYAPHSTWEDVPDMGGCEKYSSKVFSDLLRAYQTYNNLGQVSVSVFCKLPTTPWRQPSGAPRIQISGQNTKPLSKIMRRLLKDPRLNIPDALFYGPDHKQIIPAIVLNPPKSSHETIYAMQKLHDLPFGIMASDISA